MKTTVALTGASGAMGSEVLKSLLLSEKELIVRCLMHRGGNKLPKFVRKTVKKNKARIEFIEGSLTDKECCKKLVDGADYVIHCGSVIPPKADHDGEKAIRVNYGGTVNIIEGIKECGGLEKTALV